MSDKGSAGKGQPIWLASAWLLLGAVVYLSLARLNVEIPDRGGDKVGHVVAYAVLTFWFMQVYVSGASRRVVAVALVMLGVALEFAQGYTDYRSFDRVDMIANAIGVVVGWVASPPRTPNLLARLESYIAR